METLGSHTSEVSKWTYCRYYEISSLSRIHDWRGRSKIWGGIRCLSIQISAVKLHKKLDDHKWTFIKWRAYHFPKTIGCTATLIEPTLQVLVDYEKMKIFICMKLLYFVIYKDQPLLHYVDQCKIHMLLSIFDMLVSIEYSSYINVTA
jgi:hypothetical protein